MKSALTAALLSTAGYAAAANAIMQQNPFDPLRIKEESATLKKPEQAVLQLFSLRQIKLVGTIGSSASYHAIFMSPTQQIYLLKTGQQLGTEQAAILTITADQVQLSRVLPDPQGHSQKHIILLQVGQP